MLYLFALFVKRYVADETAAASDRNEQGGGEGARRQSVDAIRAYPTEGRQGQKGPRRRTRLQNQKLI